MIRGNARARKKRRRREAKSETVDLDKLEDEMRRHYGLLLIREVDFERRMRNRAIKMFRRRRKQTDNWVV